MVRGLGLEQRNYQNELSLRQSCTLQKLNDFNFSCFFFHLTSNLYSSHFATTSNPGSFLLRSKDPGRRWSRDLLKSSRFQKNYLGFLYDNHTKCKLQIKLSK
jgi:hypothetical protein